MATREEQVAAAKAKAEADEKAKLEAEAKAREAAQNDNVKSVKSSTASAELAKQDVPETVEEESTADQSYVHLSNGEVLRCENEQLPQNGGSNAPFGHWVKDGKAFQVVGVYPVESVVK